MRSRFIASSFMVVLLSVSAVAQNNTGTTPNPATPDTPPTTPSTPPTTPNTPPVTPNTPPTTPNTPPTTPNTPPTTPNTPPTTPNDPNTPDTPPTTPNTPPTTPNTPPTTPNTPPTIPNNATTPGMPPTTPPDNSTTPDVPATPPDTAPGNPAANATTTALATGPTIGSNVTANATGTLSSGVNATATGTDVVNGTRPALTPDVTFAPTATTQATGAAPTSEPFQTTQGIQPVFVTVSTTQAIAPIPTASIAQIPDKRTIPATNPQVTYQGEWSPVKSSCDTQGTAVKCTEPSSLLSYSFKSLEGGAVYLGTARDLNAGVFVVVLDGVQTKIDGFSDSSDGSCSYTWSQTQLAAGFHNLTVSLVGPSPQAPIASDGSFQLNNIQLIAEDTSGQKPTGSGITLLPETRTILFFGILCIFLLHGL